MGLKDNPGDRSEVREEGATRGDEHITLRF